jgi:hypothetical protein
MALERTTNRVAMTRFGLWFLAGGRGQRFAMRIS